MSRIWIPGGAGGPDLDVVTAAAEDVLAGKVIVGPDGEPLTGVLTLSGSAADSQVLKDKTYYNTDAKTKRTGTMANQEAVAPGGLNAGDSYTIPAGYHNGQGKVSANSLASQTGVQSGKTAAAAGQILTGYEAWVNGGRVTGTMANQGKKETSLNCGGSYTIPAGYHNGQGKVTANSLASQTDSNAAAGDIRKNKTAYVNGSKVTGTLAEKAVATYTPGTSNQTIAANQILTGVQTIKGDANLIAANIKSGKSIFGVAGTCKDLKTKSGGPISVIKTKLSFKNGDGSSHSFYYIDINLGFTPVLVCIFYAYGAATSCLNGNANLCETGWEGGYYPLSENPNIKWTSTLVRLPIGRVYNRYESEAIDPDGDFWYHAVGY